MTATPLHGLAAIDLADLHPSPANPRDQLEDIDGLAISIREQGLIQPLVVQKIPGQPGYQIVAGHRRHAALQRLGQPKALCVIRKDMLPDEELLAMLVENGQRSGLDPIEEARAYRRLKNEGGLTVAEIATKVGRGTATVTNRLALLTLPIEEQEEIRAGHSTLSRAATLVRSAREAERRREKPEARPIGRPKGAKTRPHFGDTHPLAKTARAACSCIGRPKVAGGVACGPCWEQTIREHQVAIERAQEAS